MISYTIVIRNVKYARLEFKQDGLRVIVPRKGQFNIESFIEQHRKWIERKAAFYNELKKNRSLYELQKHTEEELVAIVGKLVVEFGQSLRKLPHQVTYRVMKSRWGSCSSKGDIKFNKNLRFLPHNLISYVVFHEMCHLLVLSHNKAFKKLMKSRFLNLRHYTHDLSIYGSLINF